MPRPTLKHRPLTDIQRPEHVSRQYATYLPSSNPCMVDFPVAFIVRVDKIYRTLFRLTSKEACQIATQLVEAANYADAARSSAVSSVKVLKAKKAAK